ncbi:MAG: translation initiation factor eIF-1A [Candidatus Diapherotrites archaeon]
MLSRKELEERQAREQEEIRRIRLPHRDELEQLGIVTRLHGSDQIKVQCEDGTERMIRIPGKMRKRVWIRENDVVIVRLWDFQPIKGDVTWRYTGVQAEHLRKKGYLEKLGRHA